MKKFVGAALAALMIVGGSAIATAKEWTKVRIATEGAYAPFNYVTPDGELAGFDVDIAKALCAEMKVECTIVKQDWDGMIPALLARKFDAIVAQMSITEERKKRVAFTDKYSNIGTRALVRKGSGIEVTEAGLAGKKIGVQRETIQDKFLTAKFGNVAEIVRYPSQDEANLDMVAGRVDMLFADPVSLEQNLLKGQWGKDFEFVGPEFRDPEWFGSGTGIAIRQDNPELVEMFNKAIVAIRADGTYQAIAARYFGFDPYGAD